MSPVVVLMGLLVLAYFGSMLVGGRAIRGFGLPSGTEFVLLGIFVGPHFMGFVTRSGLASFEPLVAFALTWLGLTIGLHYGVVGDRRISKKRLLAGLGLATLTLAITGGVTAAVAFVVTPYRGNQLAVLALGCAAASTETTRHAVRWVTERYGASGPLSQLVADVSEADDAIPIGALAILAVLVPQSDAVVLPLPAWVLGLGTVAAGGVIGATCAALVDIEPRTSQRWGIVLGSLLLAGGISLRLGLSAVTTAFVMGIVASALASTRAVLARMVATSERAVMLPSLFLAGAYVSWPSSPALVGVVAAGFIARVLAKLFMARLLTRGEEAERAPRVSLGLGLLPAGVLTMTVGLACALRFPGPVGDTILALAAVNAAVGEVIGPAMLRRAMKLAGEIPVSAAMTPLPVPSRVRAQAARRPRVLRGRP
ncbi:MAG: potassium transporter Kef [Polyangiaceae bacterium]|nr:potassium transporter Kef [Polyangiaceae bacterium]